jgi:glycosyltransferase involved in cell wall biosynthesis
MKIVHYMACMRLEEGGVVRAVLDICGVLAARGHEVRLLTFDAGDVPESWKKGGDGRPQIMTLPKRFGPWPGMGGNWARPHIEQADVVHLHVPWDPMCMQLGRMARKAHVPYVVGIHGMLDDWSMSQRSAKKRLYLALGGRSLLEQAAAVHCTAEGEREQSAKWYPRGNPVIVPLIVDLDEYQTLPGPEPARTKFASAFGPPEERTVLFLSRLHPKKRPEALIEAVAMLRDDGRSVRLLIAGTGDPAYERSLRQLVVQNELSETAVFVGFVSGREKLSLYQAADVFVLPTSQENWGFVFLESLACATPVITTRGVDIWPELEASGGAVIVDPAPASIAAAIADVLADADKLASMQARGRAWVLESLSVDEVTRRYEELYRGVAGG